VPKPTQLISSNIISKQSQQSNTDDNHLWVTPPVRRKLSSSTDHNDFDERKPAVIKRVTSVGNSQPPTKTLNKPTATVKPNVIENTNKTITSTTNPMLKRIPKKTTPTKVRIIDIDLDKVPVTSTISLDDTETNLNKQVISTSLKRSSNGTNEIPKKKPKINSTTKQPISTTVVQNIKKKVPITSKIFL
jgi:hypothetical protein